MTITAIQATRDSICPHTDARDGASVHIVECGAL